MRHRNGLRKLNRTSSHRLAMLRKLHAVTGKGELLFPSVRSTHRPISDNTLNAALSETWLPFVQTVSGATEQNYIFTREANDKYVVLIVSIEQRDATVIQVTLSPTNFARLLKDPEGTGKAIAEEATINDQE